MFRFELHLPYMTLREKTTDSANPFWDDLSFLFPQSVPESHGQYSIYESQTTLVISGHDHQHWYGYAFGSSYPSTAGEDYLVEETDGNPCIPIGYRDGMVGHVTEDNEWSCTSIEDVFAAGGLQAPVRAPTTDPRIYFLRALQLRMEAVVCNHEYLVRKLQDGLHDSVSLGTC
jgi:hypothetical protein